MAEKCGCSILRIGDRDWTGYPPELVISYCPLHAAAPLMLEALKNEAIGLANMAAMVDPVETEDRMTSVYAAIAAAEPTEKE